jgi:hypothetical protein
MQPCNRIYYSTVHWRLNMFQAAYRSSPGALTVFAASGLHTHVVTGHSQVWVENWVGRVPTQTWLWPVTTCVCKPEAANTVRAPDDERYAAGNMLSLQWTQFPLRLDYGRSPHAYVSQRLQIQLELLVMSGIPLETCWAFNEQWNNKFCYKVASCWLFLLNHIAMHGSMNIK